MLIYCPRCQFQQPQDKYCARCGVDIELYKPPQKSAFYRGLSNPIFQVAVVVIIAVIAATTIIQRQKSELNERVQYLRQVQVVNSINDSEDEPSLETSESENPENSAPAPEGIELAASSQDDQKNLDIRKKLSLKATSDILKSTENLNGTNSDSSNKSPVQVKLTFAEISNRALDVLTNESQSIGQFNRFADYSAGIIPSFEKKIASFGSEFKILYTEKFRLSTENPIQLFQGLRDGDDENETGLRYYVEFQEFDGNIFKGHMEIARSWKVQNATPTQRDIYPAVFELSQGSGFYMSGLLPHQSYSASEAELLALPPFEILKSRSFISRASDAILFIEFTKISVETKPSSPLPKQK